ncbi:MAG TPA: fibronectin type III domain-containing protein, partial [Clostridia bacterium]|nr:fibronectin type III domain-containing protein [Clostridia bacterium]
PYTVKEDKTLFAHWKKFSSPKKVSASSTKKNSIIVKWSEVSGASGYEVYYGTSSSKITELISKTDSLSCKKAGLKSGKNYYFKVRAYTMIENKKVYSSYSAIVKCKP